VPGREIEQRVGEVLAMVQMGEFGRRYPRELSGGQQQRIALARCFVYRPSVVLLDEPSSGIAQREAEALAPLLLRIRDVLGAALVVIEHDMSLITSVSDRLVALDQGEVLTVGPPAEVLEHPDVVLSYLGGDSAVIGRSAPSQPERA